MSVKLVVLATIYYIMNPINFILHASEISTQSRHSDFCHTSFSLECDLDILHFEFLGFISKLQFSYMTKQHGSVPMSSFPGHNDPYRR